MKTLPEEIDPQLTIHGGPLRVRFIVRSCDADTLEIVYRDDEHEVESAITIPNGAARNLAQALEMFADWFESD